MIDMAAEVDSNDDYQRLLKLIQSAGSAEKLQKMMQDTRILTHLKDQLARVITTPLSPKAVRIVMTAFLIEKYPETMFGDAPTSEESTITEKARYLCMRLQSRREVDSAFEDYTKAFQEWQAKDKRELMDSLFARYLDLERSIGSNRLKEDEKLLDQLKQMQQQVLGKIKSIGGEEVVNKLTEQLMRDSIPTDYSVIPLAKIIHELCFSKDFTLVDLVDEHRGGLEEKIEFNVTADDGIKKFIEYLKDNLLQIIPKGTREEVSAHLQTQKLDIDIQTLFAICVDIMGSSCAPVRDRDIEKLREAINNKQSADTIAGMIAAVIGKMNLDFVSFEFIRKRPYFLEMIVPYERQYFTNADLTKTKEIIMRHADYTEWLFDPDAAKMETMQFDNHRLSRFRDGLSNAIRNSARKMMKTDIGDIQLSHGLPRLLKERLVRTVRETVTTGALKQQRDLKRDGFVADTALLHTLLEEIGHFYRLHLKIHGPRYRDLGLLF